MKVAYITNCYNNEVIKVHCHTEEEYEYWRRVLSWIEDMTGAEISFGDREWLDVTDEEMENWEIEEVAR